MPAGYITKLANQAERLGSSIRRNIYPLDVLIRAVRDFMQHNGMTYAAAMSYYVLFSVFPTMIFIVTVFGFIVRDPELQERVVDSIVDLVPAGLTVRAEILNVISDVSQASSPILAVAGLLGTAWTASNMFGALRRSLNLAFNIVQTRHFVLGRLMDILNLPAIMILALLSVTATAAVRVTQAFFSDVFLANRWTSIGWNIVYFLLPYLISFLVFLMVYRVIPNARFPFRYLAVGATFAALGFELAKAGFSVYVENFGSYQEVYGTLGGVVAFLFFVFIVANIIIFGAEISSEVVKDYYRGHPEVDDVAEVKRNAHPEVEAASRPTS